MYTTHTLYIHYTHVTCTSNLVYNVVYIKGSILHVGYYIGYTIISSTTSDTGHSEIGIQYNKPLNKGHFSMPLIIGFL